MEDGLKHFFVFLCQKNHVGAPPQISGELKTMSSIFKFVALIHASKALENQLIFSLK